MTENSGSISYPRGGRNEVVNFFSYIVEPRNINWEEILKGTCKTHCNVTWNYWLQWVWCIWVLSDYFSSGESVWLVKDGDSWSNTWKCYTKGAGMKWGIGKIRVVWLLFKNMYWNAKCSLASWDIVRKSICEIGCSGFCLMSVKTISRC